MIGGIVISKNNVINKSFEIGIDDIDSDIVYSFVSCSYGGNMCSEWFESDEIFTTLIYRLDKLDGCVEMKHIKKFDDLFVCDSFGLETRNFAHLW